MKPPTSQKEVRQLIGVVNYYNNMWEKVSHTLAPLTNIQSSNVKFKWTKQVVDRDTFLAYTVFNKEFKINTDARKFQLGLVIIHKGKLMDFYSRKLTDDQKRYTVTKKELLGIVETINQFRTIIIGQVLRININNKNTTCIFKI